MLTMLEWIRLGGPMTLLILGCGVVAAWVVAKRMLDLHRAQIKTGDFLKGIFNVVSRGNLVEAVSICEETPGPVAQMVRVAVLEQKQGRERVQRAMEEVALAEIPRLERLLPLLLTIAQITPLIGLLGTVLGMMDIMQTIHLKSPLLHAGDLDGGLWTALVSTAFSLSVAIPTYAAYNLLVSRVESIVLDMERSFGEIVLFLSRLEQEEH